MMIWIGDTAQLLIVVAIGLPFPRHCSMSFMQRDQLTRSVRWICTHVLGDWVLGYLGLVISFCLFTDGFGEDGFGRSPMLTVVGNAHVGTSLAGVEYHFSRHAGLLQRADELLSLFAELIRELPK